MAKSRDAFRTISEVSDWLDTPAHVLRFWESKFPQIKPVKRAGGRRYYRPDDMALLSGIKLLLHEQGMTIKGAQKLLREKGVRHVTDLGAGLPLESDDVIEARVSPSGTISKPVAEHDLATGSDPASWDPDDPWPADPVLDNEAAPPAVEAPVVPPAPPARPTAPPTYARSAAEASDAPTKTPEADLFEFARTTLRTPPAMPDEDAILGQPGLISMILGADSRRVRSNASRIAPLVFRLEAVARRLSRTEG